MQLKSRLAGADTPLSFAGALIPSAVSAQAIAAAGVDMLMIDLEHMATDGAALHAMIAATQGTDCAPLVRVPGHAPEPVKRALDMGAEGIVFPLVRDAAQAAACVAATRYPPRGVRGWGPFAAHARWGVPALDYLPRFGDRIVTGLLIETAEAVDAIDAILAVDGVDFAFIAPFDLSTALGVPGDFAAPAFAQAVARIEAAARAAGTPLGGMARDRADAGAMRARGYRIVGGFDLFQLRAAAEDLASWTR